MAESEYVKKQRERAGERMKAMEEHKRKVDAAGKADYSSANIPVRKTEGGRYENQVIPDVGPGLNPKIEKRLGEEEAYGTPKKK